MDLGETKWHSPGDFIKINNLVGQIVWISQFEILQFGKILRTLEICLFLPNTGRYKTFLVNRVEENFDGVCTYSSEVFGSDGL